ESFAATRGELSCDVDHELADGEQREKHVVVEREIPVESCRAGNSRPDRTQVVEVAPELRQALHEERHRAIAASFTRRVRRRKGSRSAARSWTSRTNAWSASAPAQKTRLPATMPTIRSRETPRCTRPTSSGRKR